jgi:predicted Zn-dependent protease
VREKILNTLHALRAYALAKGSVVTLDYHEEDSSLMRFANSAISLNTNEHLIRLGITAYEGRKRASYDLITDLEKLDEMKKGVDIAVEMVAHAQPLEYDPTLPNFTASFADESGYDASLAILPNEEKLAYFNTAVKGLETEEVRLSGVFANGGTTLAQINTRTEHTQYFRMSDAYTTVVLAHAKLKWEVQSEQSAHSKAALNPGAVQRDLTFLLDRYLHDTPQSLPLGKYDIVFGSAAIADMLNFMNWIAFNGGSMKRGYSMIAEDKIGQKVFSEKVTLVDDPLRVETFPFQRDLMGMVHPRFPLFDQGVFRGYTWYQDDADEFGAQPTGHTLMHKSLVMRGGEKDLASLEALVNMPRENDLLYIPFLHYMNIVNPVKGLITASSRFGALYLKKDGSVAVPFNVRITQSLLDIFGEKVAWLAKQTVPYNMSNSYGARNPSAIVAPLFMCVKDLEISNSNNSY